MNTAMKTSAVVVLVACALALLPVVVGGWGDGPVEIIGPGYVPKAGRGDAPGAESPSPHSVAPSAVPAGVPVGSVVGWLRNQTNTPALPRDWVECSGQTLHLPGSPYDGLAIPDLNGATAPPALFLRGATQSGGTGGSDRHRHGGVLLNRVAPRTVNVSAWDSAENLPPYYEVVWIMKVL